MNSRVRVVKRGKDERPQNSPAVADAKAGAPCEREIAGAVKSWIAEREQRRRQIERESWDMLVKFAR